MNKLDTTTRSLIIRSLIEGNSIRATSQLAGVSKNTVNKLLIDSGKACFRHHDEYVRNIKSTIVQCDEIWSFSYAEQKDVKTCKTAADLVGDTWTWIAIDSESKLIVSYLVGGRDSEYAIDFIDDLRSRLIHPVRLITDEQKAQLKAVEDAYGCDVDYAELVKFYGKPTDRKAHERHYSQSECLSHKKRKSAETAASASYYLSESCTPRMHMRSLPNRTGDFTRRIENHHNATALHIMHSNFIKVHETLQVTPAIAAGLTDRIWDVGDIVAMLNDNEQSGKQRGPYKMLSK